MTSLWCGLCRLHRHPTREHPATVGQASVSSYTPIRSCPCAYAHGSLWASSQNLFVLSCFLKGSCAPGYTMIAMVWGQDSEWLGLWCPSLAQVPSPGMKGEMVAQGCLDWMRPGPASGAQAFVQGQIPSLRPMLPSLLASHPRHRQPSTSWPCGLLQDAEVGMVQVHLSGAAEPGGVGIGPQ